MKKFKGFIGVLVYKGSSDLVSRVDVSAIPNATTAAQARAKMRKHVATIAANVCSTCPDSGKIITFEAAFTVEPATSTTFRKLNEMAIHAYRDCPFATREFISDALYALKECYCG